MEEVLKASSKSSNSTSASMQPWPCLKKVRLEDLHKFPKESTAVKDVISRFPNHVDVEDD